MSSKPALRAVRDDELAPEVKYDSVADAAESGDHLALLVAMRDRIAVAVSSDTCPPRDLASLTKRLDDIAKEIREFKVQAKQETDEHSEAASDDEWSTEAI